MQEKKAGMDMGRFFLTVFLLMALFGTAFGISLIFSKDRNKNMEGGDIVPVAEVKLPKTLTLTPTPTIAISPAPTMASQAKIGSGCKVGGCNSEICLNETDEVASTTCVFLEKFKCYQKAVCEKQSGGDCDWTLNPVLNSCLTEAGKSLEENKFCGGIAGLICLDGYTCKLDSTLPDSGGKCIKN
jgi:hypothetical protein